MEKNLTPATYTCPHSGKVYTVVATPQSYVEYREFMNPETKYTREYTQYDFLLDGKRVTFAFDLDQKNLEERFGIIEGVYGAPFTSRFD